LVGAGLFMVFVAQFLAVTVTHVTVGGFDEGSAASNTAVGAVRGTIWSVSHFS